jgi:hypothetical protein
MREWGEAGGNRLDLSRRHVGLEFAIRLVLRGSGLGFKVRVRVLHERLERCMRERRKRRVGGCSRVKHVRSIEKTRGPKP